MRSQKHEPVFFCLLALLIGGSISLIMGPPREVRTTAPYLRNCTPAHGCSAPKIIKAHDTGTGKLWSARKPSAQEQADRSVSRETNGHN
jgi:hypothetical protein